MLASIQASQTSESDMCAPARLRVQLRLSVRAVAKQGFRYFSEDRPDRPILASTPRNWCHRVFEVHPEVAFCQMNDLKPVLEPKKVRGMVWLPGIKLRGLLLAKAGIPPGVIEGPLPKAVGRDDWLDALAALVVARRIGSGEAVSYPSPPEVDALEIPVAIWA